MPSEGKGISSIKAMPSDGRAGTVSVWDPIVRVFHWSLVAAFAAAYLSGEASSSWHEVSGYTVLALVVARIAWGFIGSRHARFTDFVKSPRQVWRYLLDLMRGRAKRYLGHNPAGGAMILALLLSLLVVAVTGHLMLTEQLFGNEWLEDLHEASAHVMLILIGLHIAGVLASSLLHGENLVLAMITGRKKAAPGKAGDSSETR